MSFLNKFQAASKHIKIVGNICFIEEIGGEELSKEIKRDDGSSTRLILAEAGKRQLGSYNEDKPLFVRVLDVGQGFVDEDGKDVPADAKIGQVLMVPSMSVRWLSVWGGLLSTTEQRIGYGRENEKIAFLRHQTNF